MKHNLKHEEVVAKAKRLIADHKAISMSEAKRKVLQEHTKEQLRIRPEEIK